MTPQPKSEVVVPMEPTEAMLTAARGLIMARDLQAPNARTTLGDVAKSGFYGDHWRDILTDKEKAIAHPLTKAHFAQLIYRAMIAASRRGDGPGTRGDAVGAAEQAVGVAVYERIETLMGQDSAELDYLTDFASSVEEHGFYSGPVKCLAPPASPADSGVREKVAQTITADKMAHILRGMIARGTAIDRDAVDRALTLAKYQQDPTDDDRAWAANEATSLPAQGGDGPPAPVREAAQAVVDRWDSPLWKDAEPTAHVINRLRQALAQPAPKEGGDGCSSNEGVAR